MPRPPGGTVTAGPVRHVVQGCLRPFALELSIRPGAIVRNLLSHDDSHLAAHEAAKMPESEALLGTLAEICVCFVAAKRRRIVNFGFALSLVLAGFAVVGVFIEIPFVSNYAFWIAIGAYVILAATQKH
jgi:hypothetical protein